LTVTKKGAARDGEAAADSERVREVLMWLSLFSDEEQDEFVARLMEMRGGGGGEKPG